MMYVPQVNSLNKVIATMEVLSRCAPTHTATIAHTLDIAPRNARYILDLLHHMRWVKPLELDPAAVQLTTQGWSFVRTSTGRPAIFEEGILGLQVVQHTYQHRRQHKLTLKQAIDHTLEHIQKLAPSTRSRRSSSLFSLLKAIEHPELFDWDTGEDVDEREVVFSFTSRSFLTHIQMRAHAQEYQERIEIGWPMQVVQVHKEGTRSLELSSWSQASYINTKSGLRWFGSIPINAHTDAIIARRGRAWRALLAITSPYISLTLALLTAHIPSAHGEDTSSCAQPPAAHITQDMWGIHLWRDGVDFGPLDDCIALCARALAMQPVKGQPFRSGVDAQAATLESMIDVGLGAKLWTRQGSLIQVSTTFLLEYHDERRGEESLGARLHILHQDLNLLWRRFERHAKRTVRKKTDG